VQDPPHAEFHDALERAADLGRRLDGEDLETTDLDDAEHWEMVYRELCAFKEDVIRTAQERGSGVRDEGQEEVRKDLQILTTEAQRLRARLELWRRRRAALAEQAN
jgi:hypothetical protein